MKGATRKQAKRHVLPLSPTTPTSAINQDLARANQLTKSLRVRAVGNYPVKKPVDVGDGHYRILSLDGGGLRAIIETVILSRLVEVFPDLLQRVDLIGTHAPFGLDYAVRNSS